MDETTYLELNFGGGKSPEEVAAEIQMRNTIMYGVAAIVVLILILIAIKMFKKGDK